jgi:hypothetical protein
VALRLATSTDRTISGPKLTLEAGCLVVDYDYEGDDGRVANGRILFEDLLSFQFWDSSCCPSQNVLPATEVRVLEQSEYLDGVKGRWDGAVGWQEWQQKQGGRGRFRHFTVYFDDAGSIDVVASRCHIDQ